MAVSMKKLTVLVFLSLFVLGGSLKAQDYGKESSANPYRINRGYKDALKEEDTLRPGMERKKIGSITTIVPEGTEIYEKNGLLIIESPEEYSARRFKEMESHFEKLEKRLLNAETDIEDIEIEVGRLKDASPEEASEPEKPEEEAQTQEEGVGIIGQGEEAGYEEGVVSVGGKNL